jgi:hypothetical protein
VLVLLGQLLADADEEIADVRQHLVGHLQRVGRSAGKSLRIEPFGDPGGRTPVFFLAGGVVERAEGIAQKDRNRLGPVGGGKLGMQSERIKELTHGAVNSTPEAALRFVLAHPGVTVALSGMSSIEMLEQNVDIVSNKPPFSVEDIAVIDNEVSATKEKKG